MRLKRLAHGGGGREGERKRMESKGKERRKEGREEGTKENRKGEEKKSSFEGSIPDLSDFKAHTRLTILV